MRFAAAPSFVNDAGARRCIVVVVMLVLSSVFAGSGFAQDVSESATAAIEWFHSYENAMRAAGTSDRHAIVEFYTDWCPWCRRLEDSTFTAPAVMALSDQYVFARVNAELDTMIARRFGVSSYPTVILFDKSGNEVDRVRGYLPPEEFIQTMNAYLNGEGTLWTLEKDKRERPNDPEVLFKIGEKHLSRGDFKQARSFFDQVIRSDQANNRGWSDDSQFALGLMLRKEREWFKAAEAFRKLTKNYPESELAEDAQLYVAWLNERAGATDEAIEEYKTFLDVYSKSSETDWVREQIKAIETVQQAKDVKKQDTE